MGAMVGWLALAIGGGLLWGACFAHEPRTAVAWGALAPLVLLARHRRAGWLGFLHGLSAWLLSLAWIPGTLVTFGKLPLVAAWSLTVLVAAYLGIYHGVFARLARRFARRFSVPVLLVVVPAAWVALEWLRTHLGGGFPWNLAAYAWVDMPGALPLSAAIGAAGVSGLLALAAAGVAYAIANAVNRRPRPWLPLLPAVLAPLLLFAVAGRWSLERSIGEEQRNRLDGLPIKLLQPDIRATLDPDPRQVMEDYGRLIAMSEKACQPGTLVVWPESAAWPFELHREPFLDRDLVRLTGRGCTILVNSATPVGAQFYNAVFDLTPQGEAGRYDKRHLVPFGEYIPLRPVFFFLNKLARLIGDFRPADQLTLLPWRGERLGLAICYEVIFPEEVAATARAGATILVTVTNDSWYGDTAAPWQHFRAVRFRAAENRRMFMRAAITGVSAVVEPDGGVAAELGVYEAGVLSAEVAGSHWLTPFTRAPWLVPLLASLLTVAAVYSSRRRS